MVHFAGLASPVVFLTSRWYGTSCQLEQHVQDKIEPWQLTSYSETPASPFSHVFSDAWNSEPGSWRLSTLPEGLGGMFPGKAICIVVIQNSCCLGLPTNQPWLYKCNATRTGFHLIATIKSRGGEKHIPANRNINTFILKTPGANKHWIESRLCSL